MPELPDILVYADALRARLVGQRIQRIRIISPFVLRTAEPPVESIAGAEVRGVRRLGKRIVLELPDARFLMFHLMIAGRFRWLKPAARPPGRIALATLEFPTGTLALTEASPKKRAAIHLLSGEAALAAHDAGGIDVLSAGAPAFRAALLRENHTLKRSLTDPRLFDGIGNAYSDEILHAARFSPIALTSRLSDEEVDRLHTAARSTLRSWIDRLRAEFAGRFPGPGEITAYRPGFAVHGRFGQPCPACSTAVQRIRYAENETNYCPRCQTGGKILADRSLSRLLRDDWPRSIEALESGST